MKEGSWGEEGAICAFTQIRPLIFGQNEGLRLLLAISPPKVETACENAAFLCRGCNIELAVREWLDAGRRGAEIAQKI